MSLLKQYFGVSIAAILYRLRDLGIISESYYTLWCREISRRGWKKQEPYEVTREHPPWLRLNVLRAQGEGQLLLKLVVPITTWKDHFQGSGWHLRVNPLCPAAGSTPCAGRRGINPRPTCRNQFAV